MSDHTFTEAQIAVLKLTVQEGVALALKDHQATCPVMMRMENKVWRSLFTVGLSGGILGSVATFIMQGLGMKLGK
jgi:hypothetical protein